MENKIKVFIYGNKLSVLGNDEGCGHSTEDGCSGCNSEKSSGGCSSCHKNSSKENKSLGNLFLELENLWQ